MKKWISALCVAMALLLAIPIQFLQQGLAGAGTVLAAEDEPPTEPVPGDGWQQDAGGYYYLKDGQRAVGWLDAGGQRYYLNPQGYRVYGPCRIGEYVYLFRTATDSEFPGALCTGITGLVSFSDSPDILYYLTASENGTITAGKWVTVSDHKYYANELGQIKLGTIKVSGKLYHITRDGGRMTFYGKSSYDKEYYYAASNGVLKTGRQTINGSLYFFDKKTGQRINGAEVKIGKKIFYFRANGTAKTGWQKLDGGSRVYYYDSKGRRVTGWYTIKEKKYYFDPENSGVRVESCWKKIGDYYYYFNAKGVMQTGFVTVGDETYYTNSKGIRLTGWQTIGGRKYYFRKNGTMKTGWHTDGSKKYYLNPVKTSSTYGAATTGWVKIEKGSGSYWYYFDADGARHTGWLTENGKRYYFNLKTGKMFTGKHTIDGTLYDFGSSGAITAEPTGPWRIEVNRKGCFVVVYRGDTEVKAFVCSTALDGVSTPTGTFTLLDKLRWHELNGPSWGQYCSHITPDILFHSVPCLKYNDNHSLNASAYNKLGTPASGGCIRLTVKHAKYLYDNCPIGTKVYISDSVARPKYVTIETAPKIPLSQNYDPTDPAI